jgi:Outer membrane protein beta-barrel domain
MKRTSLVILAIIASLTIHSQSIHLDFYGGVANYQGDLQNKRFDLKESKPAVGLGLSYDITSKLIIRGAANYMNVSGSDASGNAAGKVSFRNLRFRSAILEAQLAFEYNLLDMEQRGFAPYVFAGIAAFHFNPYSFDKAGKKIFLRSLGTEGQGLSRYPQKKLYANNQWALPFGGGIKLALNDKLQVGIEMGLRKLFTDYLDDVSGSYADSAALAAGRGSLAAAFAYRGSEINPSAVYPAEGSIRGNAKNKDWYFTTGIKISYALSGKQESNYGRGRKSKLGCPANVF